MRKKPSKFEDWFRTFIEEKNLPVVTFWLTDDEKVLHIRDNYDAVELIIKHIGETEKAYIKNELVKLDFINGDVTHVLNDLAIGYFDGTVYAKEEN